MPENRSAPVFPAWETQVTDMDYFGRDPEYVTVTFRARVPRKLVAEDPHIWSTVQRGLAETLERGLHGRP